MKLFQQIGVDILGGCCRVGPEEIKKIKRKADLFKLDGKKNFS